MFYSVTPTLESSYLDGGQLEHPCCMPPPLQLCQDLACLQLMWLTHQIPLL